MEGLSLISESYGELLAAELNGGLNLGSRWVKDILSWISEVRRHSIELVACRALITVINTGSTGHIALRSGQCIFALGSSYFGS